MIDTKTDKSGLGFPRKQNCKEIWTSKNMAALARGKRFRLLVVQLDFKRLKSCHLRFSQKKPNKQKISQQDLFMSNKTCSPSKIIQPVLYTVDDNGYDRDYKPKDVE